jgi:hypothetical protein
VAQLVEALCYKPGSIPDDNIGIFHRYNPSSRTMDLGSTLPGILPEGKVGRCVGLTNLPLLYADCFKIWDPQLSATLRACLGLLEGLFFKGLNKELRS